MEESVRSLDSLLITSVDLIWLSVHRYECYDAGVHRHTEAGISGNEVDGAFSIVVSGQYKDDKDNGEKM
jgi:E3 ubiquitin-protein ligase UHRF1